MYKKEKQVYAMMWKYFEWPVAQCLYVSCHMSTKKVTCTVDGCFDLFEWGDEVE